MWVWKGLCEESCMLGAGSLGLVYGQLLSSLLLTALAKEVVLKWAAVDFFILIFLDMANLKWAWNPSVCLTSLFKCLSQTSISSGRQQQSWCWARRPRWPWTAKLRSCNEQGAHASRLMCFYCHAAPIRAVMPFNPPPSISLLNGGQDGGRKVTVKSPGGDGGCLWTRVHLMDKTFWQRCIAVGHIYKWWEI